MDPLAIVIVVVFLAGVVGYWFVFTPRMVGTINKRRNQEVATEGEKIGLHPVQGMSSEIASLPVPLLTWNRAEVRNLRSGVVHGSEIWAFEVRTSSLRASWERGGGLAGTGPTSLFMDTGTYFSAAAMRLSASVPVIAIQGRRRRQFAAVKPRLPEVVGLTEDLGRTLEVRCEDEAFAKMLLESPFGDRLIQEVGYWTFEMAGPWLLVCSARALNGDIKPLVDALLSAQNKVPASVVDRYPVGAG